MSLKIQLDEVSLEILLLLQKNARLSFTEIGKKVNLSSSSVAEKIKKMEDHGIINQYTIDLNYKALDLGITAIMLVNVSGVFGFQEKKFVASIKEIPSIIECLRITGSNDFMIKVIVNSVEELKEINDQVAQFGQVNTSVVVADFSSAEQLLSQKFKS